MDRVLLVFGAITIAAALAALLGRKPGAPAGNTQHVPTLVDRGDFRRPKAPWLVAVFTAATCNTCAGVWERAQLLESSEVTVTQVEVEQSKAIHDRYRIDSVPTLVIADVDGLVKRAFLGPVTAAELWAAMADAREPS